MKVYFGRIPIAPYHGKPFLYVPDRVAASGVLLEVESISYMLNASMYGLAVASS